MPCRAESTAVYNRVALASRCSTDRGARSAVFEENAVLPGTVDDRSGRIDPNQVAQNRCSRRRTVDFNADDSSAHDDVAKTDSSNDRIVSSPADVDAIAAVSKNGDTISGQTNPVVLDRVPVGRFAVDLNAVLSISGDEVATRRTGASDERSCGTVGNANAIPRVSA